MFVRYEGEISQFFGINEKHGNGLKTFISWFFVNSILVMIKEGLIATATSENASQKMLHILRTASHGGALCIANCDAIPLISITGL